MEVVDSLLFWLVGFMFGVSGGDNPQEEHNKEGKGVDGEHSEKGGGAWFIQGYEFDTVAEHGGRRGTDIL